DIGLQYNIVLEREQALSERSKGEPRKYLNLGFSASSKIKADYTQDIITLNRGTIGGVVDTIALEKNNNKSGFLPGHIDAGVMYHHSNSLTILADYSYDMWKGYENPFENKEFYKLNNAYRYGVGMEYVPQPGALTGYMKRIKYY